MKRVYPVREFTEDDPIKYHELGVLRLYDFAPYGVLPDGPLGMFWDDTIPLLLASRHPELHVISLVPCGERLLCVNRHEPDASQYLVGKGNADPTIELYARPLSPDEYARLLKRQFERFAEPGREEDTQKWLKVADNVAHGRPAFEGAFTREEAKERRVAALASMEKHPARRRPS